MLHFSRTVTCCNVLISQQGLTTTVRKRYDAALSSVVMCFGQVAICAGCDKYYPWGAAVVGFVAAISYKFLSWLVVKLYVDDPLDAIAGQWLTV